MPDAAHLHIGKLAEQASCDYLLQQGLTLVTRNFRCQSGEIDLIMLDRSVLVFVEVRYRKNRHYGGALESVTPGKQRKLQLAAQRYLQQHATQTPARFDVVGVSPGPGHAPKTKPSFVFEWVKNAFY